MKWYDSRRTPTSDSTDVYASYSDDGGLSWAPNQRITNEKFQTNCPTCGGGTTTPHYQGDYDAITSNRYTAMAVWTDFRNGAFGSFTGYFPDFAMQVFPAADTLAQTDSLEAMLKVPAVKLYGHPVEFSATVSPAAEFSFSFPRGDSLSVFPDSLPMRITLNDVPEGSYQVTVQGAGPNGTPVHRRIIEIEVIDSVITGLQPPAGENSAVSPGRFSLLQNYPNPFNP